MFTEKRMNWKTVNIENRWSDCENMTASYACSALNKTNIKECFFYYY